MMLFNSQKRSYSDGAAYLFIHAVYDDGAVYLFIHAVYGDGAVCLFNAVLSKVTFSRECHKFPGQRH